MSKFKKGLSLLVILSLSATMALAGCGKTETKPGSNEPAKTAEAAPKPVKLKWVMVGPAKQADADKVYEEFNKRLQEKLPNTTVTIQTLENAEINEKWNLMISSGEPIDLAWTGYKFDYSSEIQKGAYLPLDELLNKYGQDLKKEIPDWAFAKSKGSDGKLYSVPNYQQMNAMRYCIFTPKELADKYLDMKKLSEYAQAQKTMDAGTYDLFEDYLEKLKADNKLQKGLGVGSFVWMADKGMEAVNGDFKFRIEDKSVKIFNAFESPEYKMMYDKMADWFKKGYIRQDALSVQNIKQDEGRKDGYVIWTHGYYNNSSETSSKMNGFPIEAVPIAKDYYIGYGLSSSNTAIARTSQNPERAMQLIDLMNTKKGADLYNFLVWGFEGQHYKKVSDSRIETGYGSQAKNENKYGLWKWAVGNAFNAYETEGDMAGWNDYIVKEVHGKAITSPLMGFKPDVSNISNELAQIAAVVKEYRTALEYGVLPDHEAKYKEFIDKMKKAGSEKIIAELQKQVDEFLKNKK